MDQEQRAKSPQEYVEVIHLALLAFAPSGTSGKGRVGETRNKMLRSRATHWRRLLDRGGDANLVKIDAGLGVYGEDGAAGDDLIEGRGG
jgi:hypothetical protein